MSEPQSLRAFGRGDHLTEYHPLGKSLMTVERITEVGWTLGKITEAERAVEKLLEGEAVEQPAGKRRTEIDKIVLELGRLHERLEALFS